MGDNNNYPPSTPSSISLSLLPPSAVFANFADDDQYWTECVGIASWQKEANDLARSWWHDDARYALLALNRFGVPYAAYGRRMYKLLVPEAWHLDDDQQTWSIAALCPFPEADALEAVWEHLCDMHHPSFYVPNLHAVHQRISAQVLALPRLARWVRDGRTSQVIAFLLSSQREILTRPSSALSWMRATESSGSATSTAGDGCKDKPKQHSSSYRMYDQWFSMHAPAALSAHMLQSGESCMEALACDQASAPVGGIPRLLEESLRIDHVEDVGVRTCMQEMDTLNQSWLAFKAATSERADQMKQAQLAKQAYRAERCQQQHARRCLLPGPGSVWPTQHFTKTRTRHLSTRR